MQTINSLTDYYQLKSEHPVITGKKKIKITMPAVNTFLANRELVIANTYNPNSVSDSKMELLKQSIIDNGFAFPVVTIADSDQEGFVIIDGFHRYQMTTKKWLDLSHLPIVVLDHDINQRMFATVQFNKARGVHQVDLDADLIRSLIQQGVNENEISKHLGIDLDTIHRYKQVSGVAEIFANSEWSASWEMQPDEVSLI